MAAEALGRGVFERVDDIGHGEPRDLERMRRVQKPDGREVVLG